MRLGRRESRQSLPLSGPPGAEDLALRERLQQLAVAQHRRCGYRPLTALLRREGFLVNRKCVLRLLREDNLLCPRKQKFVLTTDSRHQFAIHPNLVPRLKLTGLNQLWVADLTYIRLQTEFIYLAVILDASSRKVIGWALDRTWKTTLPLSALQQALAARDYRAGELVHHSDRGVQYASDEDTKQLDDHDIRISMSRRGNSYDNARCERFVRTLKQEEVYGRQYRDLEDARAQIGRFLEEVYNRPRRHAASAYRTPEEFEQQHQPATTNSTVLKEPLDTAGAETNRDCRDSLSAWEIRAGFPPCPPAGDGDRLYTANKTTATPDRCP